MATSKGTGSVGRAAVHQRRTGSRKNRGDPRKVARRERAQLRAAAHVCGPTCKRYRTGRVPMPIEWQKPDEASLTEPPDPSLWAGVPATRW